MGSEWNTTSLILQDRFLPPKTRGAYDFVDRSNKALRFCRVGARLTQAMTVAGLQNILTELPIVDENEYVFNPSAPSDGWKHGFLHWYPVGGDRGNAGRIKLAGSPENP